MDKVSRAFSLILVFAAVSGIAYPEDLTQTAPLSDAQWLQVHEHVGLLDKIAYLPSLLPVIMRHREAIGLSAEQTAALRNWRRQNYQHMVDLMNEIIEHRITLSRGALDPGMTNADLLRQHRAILRLQEDLLAIRLSCRELVVSTFSPEQWSSLAFVLEDYPEFAGLME